MILRKSGSFTRGPCAKQPLLRTDPHWSLWQTHEAPLCLLTISSKRGKGVEQRKLKGKNEARNFIVTGGAGAIGSRLARRLLDEGAERVLVVDDLSSGYRWLLPEDS